MDAYSVVNEGYILFHFIFVFKVIIVGIRLRLDGSKTTYCNKRNNTLVALAMGAEPTLDYRSA